MDYFSKCMHCSVQGKSASAVIKHFKTVFARRGLPEIPIADNMPFDSYEMRQFAAEYCFTMNTSSPEHAASNGQSERMTGPVKQLMRKAQDENRDPHIAVLAYRNTPVAVLAYRNTPVAVLAYRNIPVAVLAYRNTLVAVLAYRNTLVAVLAYRNTLVAVLTYRNTPVAVLAYRNTPVAVLAYRNTPVAVLAYRNTPVAVLAYRNTPVAVLAYRNTPVAGLPYFPAELFMSRKLRDKLPTINSLLNPKVAEQAYAKPKQRQVKAKADFDQGTKKL